jgi:hypothetical protein
MCTMDAGYVYGSVRVRVSVRWLTVFVRSLYGTSGRTLFAKIILCQVKR